VAPSRSSTTQPTLRQPSAVRLASASSGRAGKTETRGSFGTGERRLAARSRMARISSSVGMGRTGAVRAAARGRAAAAPTDL
jgi:hypothetical protein